MQVPVEARDKLAERNEKLCLVSVIVLLYSYNVAVTFWSWLLVAEMSGSENSLCARKAVKKFSTARKR